MRELTVLILVVGREKLLNKTCSSRGTCFFCLGVGGGSMGGTPYYGLYKEILLKRLSISLRLEVFNP